MRTRVTKHGDDYVLNGQKRWITNGGVASFYTVFATFDPAMKHKGIACFVVDANTPGVKAGRKENKMGQRASNTTDVIFEDVKIPKSALRRHRGRRLQGRDEDVRSLAPVDRGDRGRRDPALARGEPRVRARAQDVRRADRAAPGDPVHARRDGDRVRGDAPAHAQGGVAGRQGRPVEHRVGYAKAYGADAAMRCATDAVQIFGGYGYTKEYPVEKLMRDAKLLQIYEGTSQIQRVVIARNVLGGK